MIPQRRADQSFDDHQREVAAWLGTSVTRMNATHDRMHEMLCAWLGVPSHSLKAARGEPHDPRIAKCEETAVLHAQRLLAAHSV